MLSNIFNSIKNEELSLFTEEIIKEKANARKSGQVDTSTYAYAKINLAKTHVNTIYKKILEKLKTDKLNHFIQKNSRVFLEFTDELTYEVFDIVTKENSTTKPSEENDFLNKAYRESLFELKNEIIDQWNTEAVIQGHIKRQERFKQFRVQIISLLITIVGAIIAGIVINQCNLGTKHVQTIVKREVQKEVTPSAIIKTVQSSPEVKKEASYVYRIFKDFDMEGIRDFLKALYLKLG